MSGGVVAFLFLSFFWGTGCSVEYNSSIQKYELKCKGGSTHYVMTVCDTKEECEKCEKDKDKCVKKKSLGGK